MPINHIPTKLFHLESIDSTNNYVASLVRSGDIESGSVVLADFQSEGRGQRGTKWQAVAGENMTASLFIQWTYLSQSDQFRISMWVALGVERFLTGYGVIRFILEQFREPNQGLDYVLFGLTMGQVLSLPMILFGVYLLLFPVNILEKHKSER